MCSIFVCPKNGISACCWGFVRDTPILIHAIKLLCTISVVHLADKQILKRHILSYPKIIDPIVCVCVCVWGGGVVLFECVCAHVQTKGGHFTETYVLLRTFRLKAECYWVFVFSNKSLFSTFALTLSSEVQQEPRQSSKDDQSYALQRSQCRCPVSLARLL